MNHETTPTVDPVPNGMHTITPHLVCAGAAEAIGFYKNAFGAEEGCCLAAPDGRIMNASIRIGDSMLMLVDEMPEWGALGPKTRGGTSVTIHLQVQDADSLFDRAVKAGATVKLQITDMFWGDRYGMVIDPYGHEWSIASHVRDVPREELEEAARTMKCGGADV